MAEFQALVFGVETPAVYAAATLRQAPSDVLARLIQQLSYQVDIDWFYGVIGLAPVLGDDQVFGLLVAHTDPDPSIYPRAVPLAPLAQPLDAAAAASLLTGLHADIAEAQRQWELVRFAAGAVEFDLPPGRLYLISGSR